MRLLILTLICSLSVVEGGRTRPNRNQETTSGGRTRPNRTPETTISTKKGTTTTEKPTTAKPIECVLRGQYMLGSILANVRVSTLDQCLEQCHKNFLCNSVNFYPKQWVCILSAEKRVSHPSSMTQPLPGDEVVYSDCENMDQLRAFYLKANS